jgi:short subunit dehydrogenase-like uncharacterized protein
MMPSGLDQIPGQQGDVHLSTTFLLYGATGYVGEAAARLALEQGLRPILAGRDASKLARLAAELGVEYRVFDLADPSQVTRGLQETSVVLHCAGPYLHTAKPMVDACLATGTHYLDITGEIPVYAAIAARDAEAKERGVMLLPGVGFDVVPTDCLAVHLKQRLPSATHLALAFQTEGPAGLPPGTQRTVIELIPFGNRVRRNGRLETPKQITETRQIDFGQGPVQVTRLTWGDIFTAYYSTGIPNITNYAALAKSARQLLTVTAYLRPLFKLQVMRSLLELGVKPGPSPEKRSRTITHVWGEVQDDQGRRAVSRLHGPEPGVEWTVLAALAAVQKVLSGEAPPGYQTPALAYGADFVLECAGVTREDVE